MNIDRQRISAVRSLEALGYTFDGSDWKAAEQLLGLVRFAGTEEIPGSPYPPAGFCFIAPADEVSS